MDGRSLETDLRRVIVLGGLGLFGRTAAEQLRRFGVRVQTATRGVSGDLQVDANDPASIRSVLRTGDIVLDAAGPFYARSMALIESAIQIGFDVVDLNDDLRYAESVVGLELRIEAAGIRVLSSASSVSAVTAAVVKHSGIAEPRRVTTFLAPASRHTANAGAALSLIRCAGQQVRVFRDGQLQTRVGWGEPRLFSMPQPVGPICGRLFESADANYLPRIWPTLRDVAMYVDTNTVGGNSLLQLATYSSAVRKLMERSIRLGTWLARKFGSSAGGIGYEIETANGRVANYALVAEQNSFVVAVAPAVLAVRAIANDHFTERGLVLPDCHVRPAALFAFLATNSIALSDAK